jgi:hypothetical protein
MATWWQEAESTAPRPLLPAPAALLRERGALTVRPPSPTPRRLQGLWEELRDHGAALNRALNEALRIHGGPAWRVFQVRRCCQRSSISSSSRLILATRRSLVLVCWQQELEHRARDKYGAFDQMSTELRRLQEQSDAFAALAEALRSPESWLSYRAVALHDQLQECERQDAVCLSTLERVCTALIDWMRHCSRRGETWRRCAPWRPTGRRRWPPFTTATWSSIRAPGGAGPAEPG